MQAARGTSLSHRDSSAHPPIRHTATRGRATGVFAAVALAAYAVDVCTKVLVVERLSGHADVPVVGDFLVLHLTRNPGAAFSTGTGYTVILTCIAIIAVLVVLHLGRRLGNLVWAVALGLLLAGVSGNLTDRLFREPGPLRGHVIDFLMLPHWPVFNVADVCINVAAGLILLQAFRGIRIDGGRTGDTTGDTTGGAAATPGSQP